MLALARLAAGGPVGGGGEGPVAHSEKEKEKENLGRDVSPRPRRVHLLLGVCLAGGGDGEPVTLQTASNHRGGK